jgi:hypothetical protein
VRELEQGPEQVRGWEPAQEPERAQVQGLGLGRERMEDSLSRNSIISRRRSLFRLLAENQLTQLGGIQSGTTLAKNF